MVSALNQALSAGLTGQSPGTPGTSSVSTTVPGPLDDTSTTDDVTYDSGDSDSGATRDSYTITREADVIFDEINKLIASANARDAQMLLALQDNWFAEYNSMTSDFMRTMQEQMGGIDPATQMALNEIGERAQEQRRLLLEDLSRRGILQSGVAVEFDLRLNKDKMTAEQRLLADRVTALQDRLTNAMMQFAQMRLSAIQQFGLTGIDISARAGDRSIGAMNTALNTAMGIAGMQQSQDQFDKTFDQTERQFGEKMTFSREQAEAAAKQFAESLGYNWATLDANTKQNAIDNAFRMEQFKWQQSVTPDARMQQQTDLAIRDLQEHGTREEAMKHFSNPAIQEQLIRQGVDLNKLWDAIQKMPSGANNQGITFIQP